MEETAYHESGHAFMAAFLGGEVRSLTIEPDRDDGPERFGDVQVVWRRGGMSVKEFQNKQVLVALAGPIAETIYRDESLHPGFVPEGADDWRRAWDAAESIIPGDRLVFLEETARQLHQTLSRDENWAAIAALADELLAHESLEAEQIQEVLTMWMR